ncbi:MAG TPA: VOC family protein [Kofleriaceae bacterium]|nr:VOC family protein [Kofleriaceae bacterium]
MVRRSDRLRGAAKFRNDVEVGPGGKQIQIEDPDGNPIEIHEAPRSQARAGGAVKS